MMLSGGDKPSARDVFGTCCCSLSPCRSCNPALGSFQADDRTRGWYLTGPKGFVGHLEGHFGCYGSSFAAGSGESPLPA